MRILNSVEWKTCGPRSFKFYKTPYLMPLLVRSRERRISSQQPVRSEWGSGISGVGQRSPPIDVCLTFLEKAGEFQAN